jgi:hypothetical protein
VNPSAAPSQINTDDIILLDTISPTSTVTTVLPIPPIDILMLPNSENYLYESKIKTIKGLYEREIFDNVITDADLTYIVKSYSVDELLHKDNIDDVILTIIECFNG